MADNIINKPKAVNEDLPEIIYSHFTYESLEVLEHFGMNAPEKLNDYCCALEDAVISQVAITQKLREEVDSLKKEIEALKKNG